MQTCLTEIQTESSKLHTFKSFWDATTPGNYSSKVSVISVQGHWRTLTVVEEERLVYDLTEIITPYASAVVV